MSDYRGVDDEVLIGLLELHAPQHQGHHQVEEVGPCQLDTVEDPLQDQDMHKDFPFLQKVLIQGKVSLLALVVGRLQVGVLASQGNPGPETPHPETPHPGMALVEVEIPVADDS